MSIESAIQFELQKKILQRCEDCYQIAENKLKQSFPRPEINFKLKGKSAGVAHLQTNKIRFNPILLLENQTAFFNEVVPHEIAHLLAYLLYGRVKPHGREWQGLMFNLFNVKPKTTHNFDVSSLKTRTFSYTCDCGIIELSLHRHNKVIRGKTKYSCRKCKGILKPLAEVI